MTPWLLLVAAAWTADPEEVQAPFTITTDAGVFRVTHWRKPPVAVLDPDDRTCRLDLAWSRGQIAVTDRSCAAPIAAEATAALSSWTIEAPPGLTTDRDLPTIWFVYPSRVGPDVAVLVEQSTEYRLSLPTGVDAAPFAILAWAFLEFPASRLDGVAETCRVEVDADDHGRVDRVEVTGCHADFAAAATAAIERWHFEPPLLHDDPLPTSLTLSTTFDPTDRELAEVWSPSESRQRLWSSRRFDELTREERVWFIQASLAPTERQDLGPGRVQVQLPPTPELGSRRSPRFFAEDGQVAPRPLPDGPPAVVVQRAGRGGDRDLRCAPAREARGPRRRSPVPPSCSRSMDGATCSRGPRPAIRRSGAPRCRLDGRG